MVILIHNTTTLLKTKIPPHKKNHYLKGMFYEDVVVFDMIFTTWYVMKYKMHLFGNLWISRSALFKEPLTYVRWLGSCPPTIIMSLAVGQQDPTRSMAKRKAWIYQRGNQKP
jgi:hypothetical protein